MLALVAACLAAPARAQDGLENAMGKAIFERQWVGAPASTKSADGLGPLFDARSCSSCHIQGGAGIATMSNTGTLIGTGMILRLGNADPEARDPVYGTQLQLRALQGQAAEARAHIDWVARGALRAPQLTLDDFGYGPIATGIAVSLRRAPSLKGIARIADIPQTDILARQDPDDANHDGISGRANWIDDGAGHKVLGRFGWKASEPALAAQTARALSRDMGLSSPLQPAPWGECTAAEQACRTAPQGGTFKAPEVSQELVDYVLDYLGALKPPARDADDTGRKAFETTGCAGCHAGPVLSDLLLHDMGDGLADGVAEAEASPREWRTAPLLDVAASLKRGGLLHDARARSIEEAVAWHDGEARGARLNYTHLPEHARAALDAYVLGETP